MYASEIEANAKYISDSMGVKLRTVCARKDRGSLRGDAFAAGAAYGKGISLNRQVGGSGHAARLN